ncbi:MFS transporter [Paraglaciecola chathamensis]|nr:MFS transporter [Paraglaciecola agarilytica]
MTTQVCTRSNKSIFSYENLVLLLMVLVAGIATADRLAFNVLSPLIVKEFDLSNTQMGMLTSAFSVAMATSAMGIGWLFQSNSHRKLMLIIAVICFSVSAILGGLATTFILLLITRVIMGLSEGPVYPFAQSILVSVSSPHRRAFNNAMTQTFGGMLVGAFIAPIVLGYLAESYGWRGAFLIVGIPGLFLAVLLAIFLKNRKVKDTESAALETEAPLKFITVPGARHNVWLCIAIGMGMATWMLVQSAFLPLYLMNHHGFDVLTMTKVMSMAGVGGVLGAFAISMVADRAGRKPAMAIGALIACSAPLGALYLYDSLPLLMGTTLIGWMAAGAFGVYMVTIPAESTSPKEHTWILGLVLGIPEIIGGVIMPMLSGTLADTWGLPITLWISLAGAVIGLILTIFLKETHPRRYIK